MNAKRYSIVIERSNTGFSAWSPDVPGCCAVGDTEEETRNLREALTDHLRGMREMVTDSTRIIEEDRSR